MLFVSTRGHAESRGVNLFPQIARNIQRGRDHGVAGYNKYRKRCRLATVASWDARPEEIESPVWLKLQQVYRNLDDPGNLTQFGALPHGFLRFNPDNRDLAFIYRDREIFLSVQWGLARTDL